MAPYLVSNSAARATSADLTTVFQYEKVTVAKAEEGKPQTVSKDNEEHDCPQEKINV